MKKILIIILALLINNPKCFSFGWGDIGNAFEKGAKAVGSAITGAAKKVGQVAREGAGKVKDVAEQLANKVVDIGNTTLNCAKVAAMKGASDLKNIGIDIAKAGVETANVLATEGALNTARDSLKVADKTLDAAKETAQGFLSMVNVLGKILSEGFNIKCIRFYGSLKEIQFELTATIASQGITVNEKLNVGKLEDLAKKLFDIIVDKAKGIFK